VSDRDVDEFVAAALTHRRGPGSVGALLAEIERLREVERERTVDLLAAGQLLRREQAEVERLREALEELLGGALPRAAGDTGAAPEEGDGGD
jgi:hypothetical protein